MFKKRLLELCNSSKKWIAMTVLMNWISIICNILVILFIGNTIDKLINSNLEINYLRDGLYIGSLLVIRFLANYYSTRFSLNSSSEVKKVLREKIYEKLLDIGVNYNKFISTSSVVQIGVDGVGRPLKVGQSVVQGGPGGVRPGGPQGLHHLQLRVGEAGIGRFHIASLLWVYLDSCLFLYFTVV